MQAAGALGGTKLTRFLLRRPWAALQGDAGCRTEALAVEDRTVAVFSTSSLEYEWFPRGSSRTALGTAIHVGVSQELLWSARLPSSSSAAGGAQSQNAKRWFAHDCMAVTWQIPRLKSPVCPCGQCSKERLTPSDSLQNCLVQNCRALSAQHLLLGVIWAWLAD